MIRILLPPHLRELARIHGEVRIDVSGPVTQRVVLDAVCGGRWYDHVEGRPAYRHLGDERLHAAVALADRLASGADAAALLRELNERSLVYRGKRPRRSPDAAVTAPDYTGGS